MHHQLDRYPRLEAVARARSAASIAPWIWRQQGQALIQFSFTAGSPSQGSAKLAPKAASKPAAPRATSSSGTEAPPSASRAATTPVAAAMPTCSALPSEPKAARRPPARSRAIATAARSRSMSRPSNCEAEVAAPTVPQTAVGCQPPS